MSTEKKQKCGLVTPISAIDGCPEGHWEEVRIIIKEALAETNFSVELVSDSNEIGIIQKRIVQNIYDNDIIICDVSAKNPNVMFELGLRLAFDKPAIIIKDDKTNYSFDTAPIEHLEYPRDLHYPSIQLFKSKLRDKVLATYEASKKPDYTTFLKHFGQFVVSKIDEKQVGKDEYIMAALTELRSEFQLLAKSVRSRDDFIAPSWVSNLKLGSRGIDQMSEQKFANEYISHYKGKIPWSELTNPTSPVFQSMLDEYIHNYVPENIALKPRHLSTISKNLVDAFNQIPF